MTKVSNKNGTIEFKDADDFHHRKFKDEFKAGKLITLDTFIEMELQREFEEKIVVENLETKSEYYLEDCIRNDCNKELAEKILQERARVR